MQPVCQSLPQRDWAVHSNRGFGLRCLRETWGVGRNRRGVGMMPSPKRLSWGKEVSEEEDRELSAGWLVFGRDDLGERMGRKREAHKGKQQGSICRRPRAGSRSRHPCRNAISICYKFRQGLPEAEDVFVDPAPAEPLDSSLRF